VLCLLTSARQNSIGLATIERGLPQILSAASISVSASTRSSSTVGFPPTKRLTKNAVIVEEYTKRPSRSRRLRASIGAFKALRWRGQTAPKGLAPTVTIPQSAALCFASKLGSLAMLAAMRRASSSLVSEHKGPQPIDGGPLVFVDRSPKLTRDAWMSSRPAPW
jgi:hypothetical protein